jgi:metal-responsive CopG/Arc/MetJ family transcriptional regulator
MSINIPIDEELLRKAMELSKSADASELIQRIIEKYVHRREMENRMIALGGTMPDLDIPPRQRTFDQS